jgi:DNA-binding FadR family transcriptional regulator
MRKNLLPKCAELALEETSEWKQEKMKSVTNIRQQLNLIEEVEIHTRRDLVFL